MRTIFIAMLVALGVGLIGTSSTFSAPISTGAAAVATTAGEVSSVIEVNRRYKCWWKHYRHSRHYRVCGWR